VVRWVLHGLANIAPVHAQQIIDAGVPKQLIEVMKVWPNDPALQIEALRLLAFLADSNPGALNIEQINGVPVILGIMAGLPTHTQVQSWGLRTLAALAQNEDIALLIAQHRGIATVLNAIHACLKEKRPEDGDVIAYAITVLKRIAEHPQARPHVVQAGGAEVVRDAMQLYSSHLQVHTTHVLRAKSIP
jgi:hypothetical protein